MGAFKDISLSQCLPTDFTSSTSQTSLPAPEKPPYDGEKMTGSLGDDDPRLNEKKEYWRTMAEELRKAGGQQPERIAQARYEFPPPAIKDSQTNRNEINSPDAGVIAGTTSSHSQLITESSPMVRVGAVGSHPQNSTTDTRTNMPLLTIKNPHVLTVTPEIIDELLKGETIAYRSVFGYMTGKATATILLSQMFYWTKVVDEKNTDRYSFFYKDDDELMEETMLSAYELKAAKKRLIELGLIEIRQRGYPKLQWMRIKKETFYSRLFEGINQKKTRAEEKRKRLEDAEKRNATTPKPLMSDSYDWMAENKPFSDHENPKNVAEAQCSPRSGDSRQTEATIIDASVRRNTSPLHTENTYKDKTTTTTPTTREKISESETVKKSESETVKKIDVQEFVSQVFSQLKKTDIPKPFVDGRAIEIWEQNQYPSVTMAVPIIWKNWHDVKSIYPKLNTQQQPQQPALNHKTGRNQ